MIESLYYIPGLFKLTMSLYALSLIAYLISVFRETRILQKLPLWIFLVAFVSCTILVVDRWIEAGRPPFKTFYESLVFAVWTVSLVSLLFEYRYKVRLVGLLSSASILIIFLVALSKRDAEIIALPPALQTWMFIPHVIAYFIAYGALFVAGMTSALFLVRPQGVVAHHTMGRESRIDFADFSYQISKFGFLFLTAGLLLGAFWGQSAWSNYWGWDPKENWAFITWLIFAAYLHMRNIKSWSKQRLAWVVIIGVVAIIFTYMGMDYLPTAEDSLHVYSQN